MNPPDFKSPAPGQENRSPDTDMSTRIQGDGSTMTETARRDLDQIAEQAASDVKALRDEAGEQVSAATEKAKSFAADQKDFLAGQLNGVAAAVSKVAGELDQSDQATIARYARDLAGGLSSLGREVENNDVDRLMGKAQSFGRQQPLAFLGAAALAGFVASRFAMASAHRDQNRGQDARPDDHAGAYRGETSSAFAEGDK